MHLRLINLGNTRKAEALSLRGAEQNIIGYTRDRMHPRIIGLWGVVRWRRVGLRLRARASARARIRIGRRA